MSNKTCRYIHVSRDSPASEYLDDGKTICTYRLLNKGQQVYTEDEGHALVFSEELVEVLSSPSNCNGSPPIYTRVSEFFPWINKIVGNSTFSRNCKLNKK